VPSAVLSEELKGTDARLASLRTAHAQADTVSNTSVLTVWQLRSYFAPADDKACWRRSSEPLVTSSQSVYGALEIAKAWDRLAGDIVGYGAVIAMLKQLKRCSTILPASVVSRQATIMCFLCGDACCVPIFIVTLCPLSPAHSGTC
jgi:hypothetical protein